MFEVDHSQLHRVSLDILVDDQHICRKVQMYFCQSVHYDMQYTKSRDKQTNHLVSHCNRYWSQSVLATDNICQECAPSPAKARGN